MSFYFLRDELGFTIKFISDVLSYNIMEVLFRDEMKSHANMT